MGEGWDRGLVLLGGDHEFFGVLLFSFGKKRLLCCLRHCETSFCFLVLEGLEEFSRRVDLLGME